MNLEVKKLILAPAIISLAVTVLRLAGELKQWSPTLFNPAAGGGGALVGISWLIPVFGVYFALKLIGGGDGPAKAGRVIGFAVLGIAAAVAIAAGAGYLLGQSFHGQIMVSVVITFVALAIVHGSWPELFRTLFAYALAARVPVVVVMFFAIMGNWGTHYDVVPPGNFPEMGWLAKWIWIGLLPQLTVWIGLTVVGGMLFGGIAALFKKQVPAAQA